MARPQPAQALILLVLKASTDPHELANAPHCPEFRPRAGENRHWVSAWGVERDRHGTQQIHHLQDTSSGPSGYTFWVTC